MDKTKVETKVEPQVVKIPPKAPEEPIKKPAEPEGVPAGTVIVDEVKQV